MRDKSTGRECDPKPFVRRQMPVEVHPMQMSLRQRRIAPIEITAQMKERHVHPRHKRRA
jgi:hypothetical protein